MNSTELPDDVTLDNKKYTTNKESMLCLKHYCEIQYTVWWQVVPFINVRTKAGKVRHGPLPEFKIVPMLDLTKGNEQTMRVDLLDRMLQCNSHSQFWKEVKTMNDSKTHLSSDNNEVMAETLILWLV